MERNEQLPFSVQLDELKVTVLGTSFNINSFQESENIKVTVATGSVKVESLADSTKTVVLTKDQQASYNKADIALIMDLIDINKYIAWKNNIIVFDSVTIIEALAVLSHWYDVDFNLPEDKNLECKFSGEFRNTQLANILDQISFLTGITYEMNDNRQIIIKGSCE